MTQGAAAAAESHERLLSGIRQEIEGALAAMTPGEPAPIALAEAMRYSLLAPAKRARAMLTVLAAADLGGAWRAALAPACAIEMVHAASLILDDLPAMDDATLRRGRATCHRTFGEATASLAAIALLNRAFAVVAADDTLPGDARLAIIKILAKSIGTDGLTGGQEGDLNGCGLQGAEAVEWIHARKTAALFAAATEIGARVAGAHARADAMHALGMALGMAFQGYDDILDAASSPDILGKDTGADTAKTTLVGLVGIDAAMARADAHWDSARRELGPESDLARYCEGLIAQMRNPLAATT